MQLLKVLVEFFIIGFGVGNICFAVFRFCADNFVIRFLQFISRNTAYLVITGKAEFNCVKLRFVVSDMLRLQRVICHFRRAVYACCRFIYCRLYALCTLVRCLACVSRVKLIFVIIGCRRDEDCNRVRVFYLYGVVAVCNRASVSDNLNLCAVFKVAFLIPCRVTA